MKMTKKLEICLKHLNTVKFHIDNLEIILGYFPHRNRIIGHVEQLAKPITMQFVPIQKLLKCILDSKNFMSTVLGKKPIVTTLILISVVTMGF